MSDFWTGFLAGIVFAAVARILLVRLINRKSLTNETEVREAEVAAQRLWGVYARLVLKMHPNAFHVPSKGEVRKAEIAYAAWLEKYRYFSAMRSRG